MITFLSLREYYEEAYAWLEKYGAVYVSANTILKILTVLEERGGMADELYYRLSYGCFQNGQMNYTSLKYLAANFLGTCHQMAELWKQAKAFGVETYELEERILVQMMFTGTSLAGHFDIYLSYNQRGPAEYLKRAYLTYQSRESFVKNKVQDNRFYFLLEEEILKGERYADICHLAYLKYLSEKDTLSGKQKRAAMSDLQRFFAKKCCFGFMQKFGKLLPEALLLEDKLFIEYYAPASSEVVLHYTIAQRSGKEYQYTACKLYPVFGGIYSKAFMLFEGEEITYFITEKKEDGTEVTTSSATIKKAADLPDSDTKYCRINQMRRLREQKQRLAFSEQIRQCYFLETAMNQLFDVK